MKYTLSFPVQAHIWVTDEERSQAQKLQVQLAYEAGAARGLASDDVDDVVDYGAVRKSVMCSADKEPCQLLETLYARIIDDLAHAFPEMSDICLELTKYPWEEGEVIVFE